MESRELHTAAVSRLFSLEDLPDFFFNDSKEERQARRCFYGDLPEIASVHDTVRAVFLHNSSIENASSKSYSCFARLNALVEHAKAYRTIILDDDQRLSIFNILLLSYHELYSTFTMAERFYYLARKYLAMDDLLETVGRKTVNKDCIGARVLYRCVSCSAIPYCISDSIFERGLGCFVGCYSPSFDLRRNLLAGRLKRAVESFDPIEIQECIDFSPKGFAIEKILDMKKDPMQWIVRTIKDADPDLARRAGFYGYGATYIDDNNNGKLSQLIDMG